jgi:RNA polymerase sigma factor (sigma-70 family)
MDLRPASLDAQGEFSERKPGVAFVSGMVQARLLTPDEERYLFLRMNYLKHRAERNRRKLDLRHPDASLVRRIESDLEQATQTRNQIVLGNSRLIVALSKKLAISIDQLSDLIGEGMSPLIRSVELFDISLGNRFSTYATWAVRNQMLRWLKRNRNLREYSPGESSPSLENFPDDRPVAESTDVAPQLRMSAVNRLLQSLAERERAIVAARFGLDGQPAGQSLADISAQVGLSKERVRQILLLSLVKLRGLISYDEFEAIS